MKQSSLALALMLSTATSASAEPDRISLLLGSHHIGGGDFEEFNPGIFFTWERPRADFTVGAYRNSYGEFSAAASAALPIYEWRTGELEAFAGAAYYENADDVSDYTLGDFVPLAGLQVRQGYVFSQFIPASNDDFNGLVTFGITFPFD
ncbi:MAG: hypothetical protein AAF618_07640 [Pseudomonadota bacterium]